jgi:hypothetical protein
MKTLSRLLFAAALAAAFGSAQASETYSLEIYSNDFSDSSNEAMAGWSTTAQALNFSTPPSNTPGIRQFLGEYGGTQSVSFTLTDDRLRNSAVTLTLDFLAIRSWDGNDHTWGGPDQFTITSNLATLLDASFSNGAGLQTYTVDGIRPDPEGSGLFLPMAGSRAQYALGYSFYDGIAYNEGKPYYLYNPQDAIYGMIFSFAVGNTNTLTFDFAGVGLQETWIDNDPRCASDHAYCHYRDESWGLDNIALTLNGLIRIPGTEVPPPGTEVPPPGTEVPAPGTLAALCLGLVGLSLSRRRRLS